MEKPHTGNDGQTVHSNELLHKSVAMCVGDQCPGHSDPPGSHALKDNFYNNAPGAAQTSQPTASIPRPARANGLPAKCMRAALALTHPQHPWPTALPVVPLPTPTSPTALPALSLCQSQAMISDSPVMASSKETSCFHLEGHLHFYNTASRASHNPGSRQEAIYVPKGPDLQQLA